MIMGYPESDATENKNSSPTKCALAYPPGTHAVSVGKQQTCNVMLSGRETKNRIESKTYNDNSMQHV